MASHCLIDRLKTSINTTRTPKGQRQPIKTFLQCDGASGSCMTASKKIFSNHSIKQLPLNVFVILMRDKDMIINVVKSRSYLPAELRHLAGEKATVIIMALA
jgi:hypothetical protein